jgi:hypothetical protein
MPRSKSVKTSSTNKEYQPLEIRKLRPGELARRTGNGKFHYCIKTQEYADPNFAVRSCYHPVTESVLGAVADWVKPVVFHEMVSTNEELFAHPQVLTKDSLNPKAWQKCEQAAFREPLSHWVAIDYDWSDDPHEYTLTSAYCAEENHIHNPDFSQQLDAALAPYVISEFDHPIARRLRQLVGDLADTDASTLWSGVG